MSHEKIGNRLASILIRLNSGDTLDVKNLAEEFAVSERTIQRDLNVRFSFLPLNSNGEGTYVLDSAFIGKLSSGDVDDFANLSGIGSLYPNYPNHWILNVQKTLYKDAYRVISHHYEENNDSEIFRTLEKAVVYRNVISFRYNGKRYSDAHPYKIINYAGIWYLAAVLDGTIKSFHVGKISSVKIAQTTYLLNDEIYNQVNESESIWFNSDIVAATILVRKPVVGYFKRRQLFEGQQLVNELENGDSTFHVDIYNEKPFLSRIAYWIPNVSIIEPESLKVKLLTELENYISQE